MYKNLKKGFTLIEIIVSLAIFALVMIVALGAFLKIVDVNKRAQAIEMSVNSLTFAVEAMSRELRIGKQYKVTNNGNQVTFIARYNSATPPQPIYYGYRLNQNKIERAVSSNVGAEPSSSDYSSLTATDMKITKLEFVNDNSAIPLLSIYAAGEIGTVEKAKTNFDIQTAVSQRLK